MSTVKANNYYDASGGSNAQLYGVASPPNSMGFRNRLINGDMRIDQRNAGASITPSSNTYTVDRWRSDFSQASKMTFQQSSTAPTGFSNSLQITVASAFSPGSSDYFGIFQRIEGFNTADFAWGTAGAASVTLSFWVRSSVTGTYSFAIVNSASNRSYPATYTINSANTFEQKTVTIPGDTSGTWVTNNGIGLTLEFCLGAGATFLGTAGSWSSSNLVGATGQVSWINNAGATFYITGVQLEAGTVASPFERRDYGRELIMCQRYYQRITSESSAGTMITGVICSGATSGQGSVQLMYPMRATPTLDNSAASTFAYSDGATGTACTAISLAASQSSTRMAAVNFSTAGGLTQFRPYRIEANSSASAYLGFSSEL